MLNFLIALQIAATSTPPGGDTVGYWQQRVHYRIAATLDEPAATLHASGTLIYVNNSPDSLRELYFHQYLNAFRPGSKWSAADEREGRVRFQHLRDPDYAYERFTSPVRVRFGERDEWTPLVAQYPGAPDSTVVRFAMPRALAPRDSLTLEFRWDARLSTVPRRQGRRGRHYDFAHWFPKVAVYDRGGWQHNPLTPAGEFYGEFGTYDVSLTVAEDQVLASTGVPVSGDPGWERVRRWGAVFPASTPRSIRSQGLFVETPPAGFKTVRWIADDVHHFAWSASPDFMFEGAAYVRDQADPAPNAVSSFDTVAIWVLYRPGDEATWGNGQVVQRVGATLRWLEFLYGPYAYPQLTSMHRLDRGGTEIPMLMMNGSSSIGLNLHEGGHMYAYGILANNEWRAGWMDEGLTDHQTRWAQGLTAHERARQPPPVAAPVKGYRRHQILPWSFEADEMAEYRLQLTGRAQPLSTPAFAYSEFSIYSDMVYDRAETMYSSLRDLMGDSTFVRFLRGYYSRWNLKHVDELAMRTEAERAYGKPLEWFFDQWVHRTGVVDYSLERVRTRREGNEWTTTAQVVKRGDYLHPVPLGVRTSTGWATARGDALLEKQTLVIRTSEEPAEVRLDPFRVTDDWDRRNDVTHRGLFGKNRRVKFAWPFLDHVDRERSVMIIQPDGWLSEPGGVTSGARFRTSYQGWIDKWDAGYVVPSRTILRVSAAGETDLDTGPFPGRPEFWLVGENMRAGRVHPLIGVRAGFWAVDGIARLDVRKRFDDDQFVSAVGRRGHRTVALSGTYRYDTTFVDRGRWTSTLVVDATAEYERTPTPAGMTLRALFNGGTHMLPNGGATGSDMAWFSRAELEVRRKMMARGDSTRMTTQRLMFATSTAPVERTTMLAAANPTETFENHFVRPLGGTLAPPRTLALSPDWSYIVPGGAYLRGYNARMTLGTAIVANVEESYRMATFGRTNRRLNLWGSVFADGAIPVFGDVRRSYNRVLADAGLGVAVRGRLYDRDITLRADFPLYVRQLDGSRDDFAFRVRLSARDLFAR